MNGLYVVSFGCTDRYLICADDDKMALQRATELQQQAGKAVSWTTGSYIHELLSCEPSPYRPTGLSMSDFAEMLEEVGLDEFKKVIKTLTSHPAT
jgi:hypothetical protein